MKKYIVLSALLLASNFIMSDEPLLDGCKTASESSEAQISLGLQPLPACLDTPLKPGEKLTAEQRQAIETALVNWAQAHQMLQNVLATYAEVSHQVTEDLLEDIRRRQEQEARERRKFLLKGATLLCGSAALLYGIYKAYNSISYF